MPGLGKEKKGYYIFLQSFSRAFVKSGSSMLLGCGQSPLWDWFVGKCPISEGVAPHQLCVKPVSMDETNGTSFFPFQNSGFFPPLLNPTTLRERRVRKIPCVKSLSIQVFTREPFVFSGAALVEAVRAWSSKNTKENSVRAVPRSRCCEIQLLPALEKIAPMEISVSQGKIKSPK